MVAIAVIVITVLCWYIAVATISECVSYPPVIVAGIHPVTICKTLMWRLGLITISLSSPVPPSLLYPSPKSWQSLASHSKTVNRHIERTKRKLSV